MKSLITIATVLAVFVSSPNVDATGVVKSTKKFNFANKPTGKAKITFNLHHYPFLVSYVGEDGKTHQEKECALNWWNERNLSSGEKTFGKFEGAAIKAHLENLLKTGTKFYFSDTNGCPKAKNGEATTAGMIVLVFAHTEPQTDINNASLVCLFDSGDGPAAVQACIAAIAKIDDHYQ
jgi:hypothetical protein